MSGAGPLAEPSEPLLRRLIRNQFPDWADLPLARLDSTGVDNVLFRLGDRLIVRLPREASSLEPLRKEQVWLPRLAPHLPLKTPALMGIGEPCEDYPWPWSINAWIDGVPAAAGAVADWRELASELASFILALRAVDGEGGPGPGAHNFGRGVDLALRDRSTREAIFEVDGTIDGRAALSAWEADAAAASSGEAPRWLHGDIHAQNLLTREGRLCAVIDFGGLGVGDPACDLAAAWRLLPSSARPAFREALRADPDSWRRGRAWALSISLGELRRYRDEAPTLIGIARRTIDEVLREHAGL